VEARIRLLQGEKTRAVEVLAAHAGDVVDTANCLGELAYLAVDAGDDARATAASDRLARLPCDDPAECGRNLSAVAQIELSRGNKRRALAYYRRLLEQSPEDDYVLGRVAEVSMQLGLYGEAVSTYEKLAARHPGDPRYADATRRARDEMLRAHVGLPQQAP
jgi:tetratricopeptide (TPR) repeat protein